MLEMFLCRLSRPTVDFVPRVSIIKLKMSTETKWQAEKERILNLPTEEKRKLCKPGFITVDGIDSWRKYYTNSVSNKTTTGAGDKEELAKISLKSDLNKSLAEKVSIYKGDITSLEIDAIVNAANALLKAGGGVDGAIHRAAGPLLQAECNSLNGCPTGDAKITGGYKLPAKYVIHTVGPQDKSADKLESCYENCFKIIKEKNIKTVAFPCISTGIYGFPNRLAGHIALRVARKYLENNSMDRIIFCTFMPVDVDVYESLMALYFPVQ